MAKQSEAPIRLLLVDEDDVARAALRARFAGIGYEVQEAGDAAAALSLIGMIPFDLVLADLHGPAGSGMEVLRLARQSRASAALPIIVMADPDAHADVAEALELGANDHLPKPLDIEAAYGRAEMQVRRKRAHDEARAARRGLQCALARLEDAVAQAQNTAAALPRQGPELRTPLAGVLEAAGVLTKLCETPELKTFASMVEAAAGSLESLIDQEEGVRPRSPAPAACIRVLAADDDARTRFALRALLDAAEPEVELTETLAGLEAALMAETRTFDLILVNAATAEAVAGVRAIRRHERQTQARRVPILAVAADAAAAAKLMDAGADLHMSLPIRGEALLAALATALSRRSEDLSAVG